MTHNGHSDDRYLGFTFETEKAIHVLTDLRDLGYVHVSIRQMLVFALSKIEHRQEKLEKMKHLLEVRESISHQRVRFGNLPGRNPSNHIQLERCRICFPHTDGPDRSQRDC